MGLNLKLMSESISPQLISVAQFHLHTRLMTIELIGFYLTDGVMNLK
jgi:hypothetical protein